MKLTFGLHLLQVYRFNPTTGIQVYSYYRYTGLLLLQVYRFTPTTGIQVYSYYRYTGLLLLQVFRFTPTTGIQVYSYYRYTGSNWQILFIILGIYSTHLLLIALY